MKNTCFHQTSKRFFQFYPKITYICNLKIHPKMSKKRVLSLSFLLFASMLILAHAVIPHHHHDGIPIVAAHQEDDSNQPNHETEENWLLTIVKVRMGNDKQMCQSFYFDFRFLPYSLTLFSDNQTPHFKDDIVLPFRYHPYILHFYTGFIARAIGLRAPPVC